MTATMHPVPDRARALDPSTVAASRAAAAVLGPAVLLGALLYHPFIPDFLEASAVAAAAQADLARWGLVHLLTGVGFALVALAFVALRGFLRDAGEDRGSAIGLPLALVGSALLVFLPAFEFAPMAAAQSGAADPAAVQRALEPWFRGLFLATSVASAAGALAFAAALARTPAVAPALARLAAAGLVLAAVVRFVPSPYTLYVWGLATALAFWPLARAMARGPGRPAPQPRSVVMS